MSDETPKNREPSLVVAKKNSNKQITNHTELKTEFVRFLIEQAKKHRDERETQKDWAQRHGVSPATVADWKYRDPKVNELFRSMLPDSLLTEAPDVYATIVRRAKVGDPAMTKLMLQQARLLEAEKHENRNLNINLEAGHIPRPSADFVSRENQS